MSTPLPMKRGKCLGNGFVIGADHGTQVFGIKSCRERCRANEAGEHHGQLAALGLISRWVATGAEGVVTAT
jgi:hypothetical protein